MPDETAATSTETEEDPLLAALLGDEEDETEDYSEDAEEVEQKFAKQDDKLAKEVKALREIVTRNERQKQADKLYSEFMAKATDTAKQIYAVLAEDDMTPAQMKKVTDAALRKAQEIDEKASPEKVEEAVEARVNQELAERWGIGPVSTDKSKPEDAEEKAYEEIAKRNWDGDTRATAALILSHQPVPADYRNWDKPRSKTR